MHATLRRVTPCLASVALVSLILTSLGLPAAAGGKDRRDIKRSFTATAIPSNHVAWYAYPHVDYECGIRDVNFTGEHFKAPDDGTLVVQTKDFVGDWDLALIEEKTGAWLAGSYRDNVFGPPHERMMFYLLPGDEVEIRACNALGAPTAEVTYEFRFGG